MNSAFLTTATLLLACVLMTSSVFATPSGLLTERGSKLDVDIPGGQSIHMKLADRLLKRILDITFETLRDMGASRDDLERVQQKRNYIRNCYFQAISCY
ncbi:hypothetical protein ElyMa_001685700 [Elysia marginata]|uniref:Allatostatin C n=1 Tax=Elysia marginata TaxID=1093978 RepID=A0AAV4JRF0_9GAST|nr:hypothetical protein ElyMa_001685700 [Elysia marginata]